jgi:hypothetical protein
LTLKGEDPNDGDLSNNRGDPLVLTGIGACGAAQYGLRVTLVPPVEPLAALNTCLRAAGNVIVRWGVTLKAVGAPISTNGSLNNSGTVIGSVEAASVSISTPIGGTVTVPAPAKDPPDSDVYDKYAAVATSIPIYTYMDSTLLGPQSNPWGSANPDGVYLIDTQGLDLWIQGVRVYGTLVIRTHGASVYLGPAVYMSPARSDYPALIVRGRLDLGLDSGTPLRESDWSVNFNPNGAPYQGRTDIDQADEYPSEVHGLIHVTGDFDPQTYSKVQGVIICEGTVTCYANLDLVHDATLYSSPPRHYTTFGTPVVSPGSWQQTLP